MPIVEQPEITLASTTESQAELDHATGPNWREHFDPEKAKAAEAEGDKDKKNQSGEASKNDATKTAAASDAAKTASKAGEKTEDEEADLPKGARKRIDRLTARLNEQDRELERLRSLSKVPGKETVETTAKADAEPDLKDYVAKAKSYEEGLQKWNKDHTAWGIRQERAAEAQKNAEEQQQASAKEIFDAHLERLESARSAHDDFDDAVKAMPKFTFASPAANQAFQMAIIETENSAELMYHLATHPEEMAKFAELSPVKVQMMIGRLADKLTPASAASAAARTTAKTKTPPPTTPVRGTTTAPTDLGDPALVKDTDSWIARRQAQQSQKRRAN